MKAILEVDLDNPDSLAHLRATKSLDMALALWDFDRFIRGFYLDDWDINLDKLIQ